MMESRIVIVGFMGCGKTTVAEQLAHRFDCRMVDLDSFITEREGRSPGEIIPQDGEAAFRKIETSALRDLLERGDARVIALGGGAWSTEANRALVAQHDCLTVWLDTPFDLCWQRITASGDTIRPLAPDRENAKQLYEARRASYELAQLRIDVGQNDILSKIESELA
jgi:shikimate kinase